jgi:hypothetical protein
LYALSSILVFNRFYRDKKVVGVFVRFSCRFSYRKAGLKFGENVLLGNSRGFPCSRINEKTCQVYRKEPSKQLGP